MRRHFTLNVLRAFALLLLLSFSAFAQGNLGTDIPLYPITNYGYAGLQANTMILDADGEETAFKYIPHTTSAITDIDLNVEVTGDTTGINFRIRVESDNADAPSGTILGATNSAISASFTHTADGFTGLKALGENTGALTLNVPVWIILYRQDGSSLSGSNYVGFRGANATSPLAGMFRVRLYTAASWTGTAVNQNRLGYVVKHASGTYDGFPMAVAASAPTSATDIYGDYSHGIRFKTGSQTKITGLRWFPTKTGSPADLVVSVYEGATLKYSNTVPAASIITTVWMPIWFSSPVLLTADTNIYITLKQAADGGSDSADYDTKVNTFSATYRATSLSADMAFVYGAGNNPTAFTVSDTDIPYIIPVFNDPTSDLDQSACGGSAGGSSMCIQ